MLPGNVCAGRTRLRRAGIACSSGGLSRSERSVREDAYALRRNRDSRSRSRSGLRRAGRRLVIWKSNLCVARNRYSEQDPPETGYSLNCSKTTQRVTQPGTRTPHPVGPAPAVHRARDRCRPHATQSFADPVAPAPAQSRATPNPVRQNSREETAA